LAFCAECSDQRSNEPLPPDFVEQLTPYRRSSPPSSAASALLPSSLAVQPSPDRRARVPAGVAWLPFPARSEVGRTTPDVHAHPRFIEGSILRAFAPLLCPRGSACVAHSPVSGRPPRTEPTPWRLLEGWFDKTGVFPTGLLRYALRRVPRCVPGQLAHKYTQFQLPGRLNTVSSLPHFCCPPFRALPRLELGAPYARPRTCQISLAPSLNRIAVPSIGIWRRAFHLYLSNGPAKFDSVFSPRGYVCFESALRRI